MFASLYSKYMANVLVFVTVGICVKCVKSSSYKGAVWPLPSTISIGNSKTYLSKDFKFLQTQEVTSPLIERAIARYSRLINVQINPSNINQLITTCSISVSNIDTSQDERLSLRINSDNSYSLNVSISGDCSIQSATIWGAIYAMESFSHQLVRDKVSVVSQKYEYVYCNDTSLYIEDSSRFNHRGVLIDSSRHYLPLSQVKHIIDTLPMQKFNVLHWHISDAESSPLVLPDTVEMIKGAYTPELIYTADSIQEMTEYAADRGVTIIFEIDMPGHTGSWRFGYPEVMADCIEKYTNVDNYALNPTLDSTYSLISKYLTGVVRSTGASLLHIGGDEVVYGCWNNDKSIKTWMKENGYTSYDQLFAYFVLKADQLVYDLKATPIHWEEVFFSGVNISKSTIIQVWTTSDNIEAVVKAGYTVIASPSDYWYADHLETTWQTMYTYDPTVGLAQSEKRLIVGGEVELWGEHIDETNVEAVLYPRACAVGERLWSPYMTVDLDNAEERLLIQRCRMVQRGFNAAPVNPGYCPIAYV